MAQGRRGDEEELPALEAELMGEIWKLVDGADDESVQSVRN